MAPFQSATSRTDRNMLVHARVVVVSHSAADPTTTTTATSRAGVDLPERYSYQPEYLLCSESEVGSGPDIGEKVTLQYLAEGGANVLFRIRPSRPALFPASQLLRARKSERYHIGYQNNNNNNNNNSGSQSTPSNSHDFGTAADLLRHIDDTVCAMAGIPTDWIVPHRLVSLSTALVSDLNDALVRMERRAEYLSRTEPESGSGSGPGWCCRPENRVGTYLETGVMDTSVVLPEPHPEPDEHSSTPAAALSLTSTPTGSPIFSTPALLVQDYSPSPAQSIFGFHFKPKWLAQSPTAPARSRRCRTCALRALRRQKKANGKEQKRAEMGKSPVVVVATAAAAKKARRRRARQRPDATDVGSCNPAESGNNTTTGEGGVAVVVDDHGRCPLGLLSPNEADVRDQVSRLVQSHFHDCACLPADTALSAQEAEEADKAAGFMTDTVTRFFFAGDGRRMLEKLRDLQTSLDPVGAASVVTAGPDEETREDGGYPAALLDLQLAMTLRDCSIFIRVMPASVSDDGDGETDEPAGSVVIDARLADLDHKNIAAKARYWRDLEEEMIREGAYADTHPGRSLGLGLNSERADGGCGDGKDDICVLWRSRSSDRF